MTAQNAPLSTQTKDDEVKTKQGRAKTSATLLCHVITSLCLFFVFGCQQRDRGDVFHTVRGHTMGGVAYLVKYHHKKDPKTVRNIEKDITHLLSTVNAVFSTYLPDSQLSQFNAKRKVVFGGPHFYELLLISQRIHRLTGGAFDPTVGALVSHWGFGPSINLPHAPTTHEALAASVGFDKIIFSPTQVSTEAAHLYLDMNAIAKGYAVDLVADYLEKKHVVGSYMVEVGGEIRCGGKKNHHQFWHIGIEKIPTHAHEEASPAVTLAHADYAMATAGNYRKYTEKDGVRVGHIMDAKTTQPAKNRLLSASIIAERCAVADAVATACMVLGLTESIRLLSEHAEWLGVFVYQDATGAPRLYASEALMNKLINPIYPIDYLPNASTTTVRKKTALSL